MTIGVGVLATDAKHPAKPNTVVLMADTMGSYGDQFSHSRLHKTFEDAAAQVYSPKAGAQAQPQRPS